MNWTISTAIDSTIANSFLSRMHISMGKSFIIIEKERLIREMSSQEKSLPLNFRPLYDKKATYSKIQILKHSSISMTVFYQKTIHL